MQETCGHEQHHWEHYAHLNTVPMRNKFLNCNILGNQVLYSKPPVGRRLRCIGLRRKCSQSDIHSKQQQQYSSNPVQNQTIRYRYSADSVDKLAFLINQQFQIKMVVTVILVSGRGRNAISNPIKTAAHCAECNESQSQPA